MPLGIQPDIEPVRLGGSDELPDVDTSYETYADDPIYVSVNQALVDTIGLQDIERVADLACGTGL